MYTTSRSALALPLIRTRGSSTLEFLLSKMFLGGWSDNDGAQALPLVSAVTFKLLLQSCLTQKIALERAV